IEETSDGCTALKVLPEETRRPRRRRAAPEVANCVPVATPLSAEIAKPGGTPPRPRGVGSRSGPGGVPVATSSPPIGASVFRRSHRLACGRRLPLPPEEQGCAIPGNAKAEEAIESCRRVCARDSRHALRRVLRRRPANTWWRQNYKSWPLQTGQPCDHSGN